MIVEDWITGPWRFIEVWRPPVQGSGYYDWQRIYYNGPVRLRDSKVTDQRFALMEKYWDLFPVVQVWTWDGDKWVARG